MNTENYPYKWWALIGLSLLSFTAFLDYTIVATALPFIQKELNATVLQLQWIMNIFGMILCMFMIAAGQAGDLFGRKKVFFFGFILFGVAALGAGISPTIEWLIFFRAIQGFAAAVIFTIGVALLPQAFPANEQMRAIGIFSAFNGAGLAVGPFLGGLLISFLNWRWVFLINIPIILAGLVCCSFSLKPSPKPDSSIKIDWLGLILLVIGLGSLVYGIVHGEAFGWKSLYTWLTICIGLIALFLLIFIENKIEHPLLDLSLFRNVHATLAILVCTAAGFITFVFMFFDPLYLELMREQSAFMIGIFLLAIPLVQVIISLLFAHLVNHFGVFDLIICALGFALLASILHAFFMPESSILVILLAFILMGYAWGIANVGTISAISTSINPDKMGSAIGTVFTFWNISGSILLALSSVLFHWRESMMIHTGLIKSNMQITAQQDQQIHVILADPSHAKTILSQYFGNQADAIFSLFQSSFMSGFHFTAWFGAALMLIIFLFGLKLRAQSEKRK